MNAEGRSGGARDTDSRPLPELLGPGLRVVFCGTAAGQASARARAYYAGPGNAFWPILLRTGLISEPIAPHAFVRLLEHGIGLTDLARARVGPDAILRARDFDRERLRSTILAHAPLVLAFNGKRAAREFLGRPVVYGLQYETIGPTRIHVLPSTSALAKSFWDPAYWERLAREVGTRAH